LSLLTRGLNTLAACPLHSDRSQIEADFAQTLVKCGQGAADRHPSRLLRARRQRPRRRAAEQRDELPAFQLIEISFDTRPARAALQDIE
jgi:hypothetical protein